MLKNEYNLCSRKVRYAYDASLTLKVIVTLITNCSHRAPLQSHLGCITSDRPPSHDFGNQPLVCDWRSFWFCLVHLLHDL